MKHGQPKSIFRDFLIAEALRRELTPEDISRLCGGKPTADHVYSYMAHRGAMGEDKLDRIFKALNVRIVGPPEANVSLLAIGEPEEADENMIPETDDIPF